MCGLSIDKTLAVESSVCANVDEFKLFASKVIFVCAIGFQRLFSLGCLIRQKWLIGRPDIIKNGGGPGELMSCLHWKTAIRWIPPTYWASGMRLMRHGR